MLCERFYQLIPSIYRHKGLFLQLNVESQSTTESITDYTNFALVWICIETLCDLWIVSFDNRSYQGDELDKRKHSLHVLIHWFERPAKINDYLHTFWCSHLETGLLFRNLIINFHSEGHIYKSIFRDAYFPIILYFTEWSWKLTPGSKIWKTGWPVKFSLARLLELKRIAFKLRYFTRVVVRII